MSPTENLSYEVFVNDPPPQDNGFLPNGDPKLFSPLASTLVYGQQDAVLTDPGMTIDQARVLGDRVAAVGRNLTDIFITHGHGDHWFAAGQLAERFGARIVATAGTIAHMHGSLATRPFVWDKVYPGDPADLGHGGDGAGQPVHAGGARAGDRRGRPFRHRRDQRPARPRS